MQPADDVLQTASNLDLFCRLRCAVYSSQLGSSAVQCRSWLCVFIIHFGVHCRRGATTSARHVGLIGRDLDTLPRRNHA